MRAMERERQSVMHWFRRDGKPSRLAILGIAVIGYTLVAMIFLGANPYNGETSAPTGLLSRFSGWSAHTFATRSAHPERSDILDSLIPQWTVLKKALISGQNAFWNLITIEPQPA